MRGVSVIICCHNSERRIIGVLGHLARQRVNNGIAWEIVLIDNASTDATGSVAAAYWAKEGSISFRIVLESRTGLAYARFRGVTESKYDYVSFVDDDNWLESNWVQGVYDIMESHPEVGACGGRTVGRFDEPPPSWFHQFHSSYAIGSQMAVGGDITETRGYLWGAGLTIRKQAWRSVVGNGNQFMLQDRKGTTLTAGGDAELCYALLNQGWRLWYEPELVLYHYMPANRLKWQTLRQMHRGFGASRLVLGVYRNTYRRQHLEELKGRWIKSLWIRKVFDVLVELGQKRAKLWYFFQPREGNRDDLEIQSSWGYLLELCRWRHRYDEFVYSKLSVSNTNIQDRVNNIIEVSHLS